ncbi:MAG: hypothetical protein ACR2J8_09445 [Thermomicrobiales bacterium]
MTMLHETIGGLVVLAFLVLTIINILRVTGREIGFARPLSMLAAGLLLLQYVLGFLLMGSGAKNSNLHYVVALLAIVTVGLEHGWAANRATANQRAVGSLIASLLTLLLVLVAYQIGKTHAVDPVAAYVASFF